MNRVSILLVNWNSWAETLECLESLLHLDYPDYRIVVVDNGSTDGSPDYIRAWASGAFDVLRVGPQGRESDPSTERSLNFVALNTSNSWPDVSAAIDADLVLLQSNENLGFAGGNNVGFRFIQSCHDSSYVWLLNNDCSVTPAALSCLVDLAGTDTQIGLCGSTLLYYDSPDYVQALGGAYYCRWLALAWHLGQRRRFSPPIERTKVEKHMSYVVGASMLVSAEFLSVVGLMTEDYFLYFEEIDWVVRAKGRFRFAYAPDSLVYHKVGGSIGTHSHPAKKSLICDYYNLRNRLLFTRRYFPWALPTVCCGLVVEALLRILCGRWQRARMIFALIGGGRHLPPLSSFDDAHG